MSEVEAHTNHGGLRPGAGRKPSPPSFPCPECGGRLEVKDSRPTRYKAVPAIRRRRCCANCNHRVTTFEIVADARRAEKMVAVVSALRRVKVGIDALIAEADVDDDLKEDGAIS